MIEVKYRPDIDGLRAIAVVMVMLFHFWPKFLTGGFIGVDVFFVISGYLITSIINKDLKAGTFSFLNFYMRRMKRILPMLFCVIFVSAAVAYFIMLPHAYVIFSNTAVWASAYISNLYFIVYSLDYFNANTQFYPLLHTWTLAIEEQYYIFWPAIIWGLSRFINHKNLQLVVIVVLVVLIRGSQETMKALEAQYKKEQRMYNIHSWVLLPIP